MLLNLKKVFSGEQESYPFDCSMDLSSTDVNGAYPFVSPVSVQGAVNAHDGFAVLDADVSFALSTPCDRCTRQIEKHCQYKFSHVLVLSLEEDDEEHYVEVQDYKLDLDELIRADILLELPTKFLCRDDCKGLCPVCGKNLNEGPCNCNTHQVDPRLEVLKTLID